MKANPDVNLPDNLRELLPLALDLWYSWNEDALELFQSIDSDLWEQTHGNPVRLLQEVPLSKLEELSRDAAFNEKMRKVADRHREERSRDTWFTQSYPQHKDKTVAYFSAEFGLHESLPVYSGGLGVLAGDHCKSAGDLGVPLVGVGLLYKQGYFRQRLDNQGRQIVERVDNDFAKLPIRPAEANGTAVYIEVQIADRTLHLKVWLVQAGRVKLYLLDADIAENTPQDRELTAQLYGGGQEMRIAQEMLLGLGGVRALRAVGLQPTVFHINEGHAAFLSLERIAEFIQNGEDFATALELVRASTLFTTHTPVPAGHDAFPMDLFERQMKPVLDRFPNNRNSVIGLGYDPDKKLFNMTYLALNTASLRNGVSKLHGQVSRSMFRAFHGNIQEREVPISHITNGVHLDSWMAAEIKDLFDRFLPAGWRKEQSNPQVWESVEAIPHDALWQTHTRLKEKLLDYARNNVQQQKTRNGDLPERIEEAGRFLDPKALTIGFARRFATYKRANLIFRDLERLARIVNDAGRPVQFIFAGKAHPADFPGQDVIREIFRVSQTDTFRGKVVLLENYDIGMARLLVQGVDIWLNNPLRPLEASGTSGQKAALNGAVNFSILDGWWEEGFDGGNGWAIGSDPDADWQAQEALNAESFYSTLENEIIPLYYGNPGTTPEAWVSKMKRSLKSLSPLYNTERMVRDYAKTFYVKAFDRYDRFSANGNQVAATVARFKAFMRENWHHVRVLSVYDRIAGTSSNDTKEVKADIYLGPVWYQDVVVEIIYYQDPGGNWQPVVVPMGMESQPALQTVRCRAILPSHLFHIQHYSVRVRPVSPSFAHSFELPLLTSV